MRVLALVPAFLLGFVAAAQAAVPAECWKLRKDGHHAEAQVCFERLTRSDDAYFRAEGFWGLEAWGQANEQFRLAAQSANRIRAHAGAVRPAH